MWRYSCIETYLSNILIEVKFVLAVLVNYLNIYVGIRYHQNGHRLFPFNTKTERKHKVMSNKTRLLVTCT